MNEILPNMRLLCAPSEAAGEDWAQMIAAIDQSLTHSPYDLAEEAVYILFEPEACLVGRSVVGPLKEVEGSLRIRDWKAKPMKRMTLRERLWDRLQNEIFEHTRSASYILCLRRSLVPELKLEVEVIFSE